MSKIHWGFYLKFWGMKLGTSASFGAGVGGGAVGVTGPDYNWGGVGKGGCYFAANIDGVKTLYPINLQFVSIQGQALLSPAQDQMDKIDLKGIDLQKIGNATTLTGSRIAIEVHQFYANGKGWKDVPINLKITSPKGKSSSRKSDKLLLSRNGILSLKGSADTAASIRGILEYPSNEAVLMQRWDSCFGGRK